MRNWQDFALHLISQNKLSKIHEATLQIAVSHICGLLRDFDPENLKQALAADPLNFTRLLNVLAKLAHGGLQCEHARLEAARDKAQVENVLKAMEAFGSGPRKRRAPSPSTVTE